MKADQTILNKEALLCLASEEKYLDVRYMCLKSSASLHAEKNFFLEFFVSEFVFFCLRLLYITLFLVFLC